MEIPRVRIGQVWGDNDPRAEGRTIRVEDIYMDGADLYACCKVVTDRKDGSGIMVGKNVRIQVKRFRPTKSGYRLLEEVPDRKAEGA